MEQKLNTEQTAAVTSTEGFVRVIDMGPGGGTEGGRIVACGTPDEICSAKDSKTGYYLNRYIHNEE